MRSPDFSGGDESEDGELRTPGGADTSIFSVFCCFVVFLLRSLTHSLI